MALIDDTSEAYNETSTQFWTDELENLRVLLFEINKGIKTILTQGHASYQLDTGQGSQRVTRLNLAELKDLRSEIMFQINEVEILLNIRKSVIQVCPGW